MIPDRPGRYGGAAAAAAAFHSADSAFCAAVPAIRRSGAARRRSLP